MAWSLSNWFSVRMRASLGDKHISGGEALVPHTAITDTVSHLQRKAFSHSRGVPDACHITVEAVTTAITPIALLPIHDQARDFSALTGFITGHGISEVALTAATTLLHAPHHLRGAALLDCVTGERLDTLADRGVRVSRMSYDTAFLAQWRERFPQYCGARIEEALLLTSKVASGEGIVGELCISDDPEYTTGYFASAQSGYTRIHAMKRLGDECGGRVFFVAPATNVAALISYLQLTPVCADKAFYPVG